MYEDEQANVLKCAEIDMLLKSVERLEQRIKRKYYDYDYPKVQYPSYYGNYPYQLDEIKELLKIIHTLLKKLEGYLQSKGVYEYYDKYFEEYHSLFDELCRHYGINTDEFEGYQNFKQTLSKGELEEFEKVERLAELVNRPELVEQWKQKHEWSKLSLEQKLNEIVEKWWNEKKKQEKLSRKLTYAGKTVEEWIRDLNLRDKGKRLAKKKPWLLADPSERQILQSIDKGEIWYDDD